MLYNSKIQQKKQAQLEQLYAPYIKCTMCPLGTLGRSKVVFGEGNPDATIMLIGEGPGQDEDAQGRPFVGRSGKLLTRLLELAQIHRPDIFITNIVKCRPPNNRKPTALESFTCKDLLLLKQIEIIQPSIICTLGASALEGLLVSPVKITAQRGKKITWQNITLLPTYHPAYVLRNPSALDIMLSDIITVKEISESFENKK